MQANATPQPETIALIFSFLLHSEKVGGWNRKWFLWIICRSWSMISGNTYSCGVSSNVILSFEHLAPLYSGEGRQNLDG